MPLGCKVTYLPKQAYDIMKWDWQKQAVYVVKAFITIGNINP